MKAYVRKRVYPSGRVAWLLTKELGENSNGGRDRICESYETEKEALRARDLFLGEMAAGTFLRQSEELTATFLERWLVDVHRRNVTHRTFDRNTAIMRRHLIPALGSIPLAKLRALDIEHYEANARRLDGRPLSPASLQKHHWLLHSALEKATDWNLIRANPASKVDAPRQDDHEPVRALNDAEKALVIAATNGKGVGDYVVAALSTGMRRGEICALRWADIDLDAGIISVRRRTQESTKGVETRPATKTGRPRVVRAPESFVAYLRRHKAKQNEAKIFLRRTWRDNDLVFPQQTGGLRRPSTLTRAFERSVHACPDCDAPGKRKLGDLCTIRRGNRKRHKDRHCSRACIDARFHDLRHTHVTDLLAAGVPIKVVAERVGDSVTTMLRVYAHVLPDMQDEAARQTDVILDRIAKLKT
jgi:integrase